ncbi:hypothetical protein NBRC10513v2_007010 [Rhodotorula toruloides]
MPPQDQPYLALIGAGSMGGGMACLFASPKARCRVSVYDVEKDNVDNVRKMVEGAEEVPEDQVWYFVGEEQLKACVDSLVEGDEGRRRILILSLPHGKVVDSVLEKLAPLLKEGDIILDGDNEWWKETERRQKWLKEKHGVDLIGMGVSGGYQSARHGPSMSPGGARQAYDYVEPILKAVAAQDPDSGEPCTAYVGEGGSGHHVKMVHNGIEQGILSAVTETFDILHRTLGYSAQEISALFARWNSKGRPLETNFLVEIGSEIAKRKEAAGTSKSAPSAVDDIEDKVTQDVDNSEGTGVWTNKEWAERHVPAPTIALAHCLRLASSNKGERLKVAKKLGIAQPRERVEWKGKTREQVEATLEKALYGASLASFAQGCDLIAESERQQQWGVSMETVIQIWRGGCIITSLHIARLFQDAYRRQPNLSNILLDEKVAEELAGTFEALKEVVAFSIETDAVASAFSASLEYMKMEGTELLPTYFEEAELDLFGTHSYDVRHEHKLEPKKGPYHEEWKPA